MTPEEGYRIAAHEVEALGRGYDRLEADMRAAGAWQAAELRLDALHDEDVRGHWRDWEREQEELFLAARLEVDE